MFKESVAIIKYGLKYFIYTTRPVCMCVCVSGWPAAINTLSCSSNVIRSRDGDVIGQHLPSVHFPEAHTDSTDTHHTTIQFLSKVITCDVTNFSLIMSAPPIQKNWYVAWHSLICTVVSELWWEPGGKRTSCENKDYNVWWERDGTISLGPDDFHTEPLSCVLENNVIYFPVTT